MPAVSSEPVATAAAPSVMMKPAAAPRRGTDPHKLSIARFVAKLSPESIKKIQHNLSCLGTVHLASACTGSNLVYEAIVDFVGEISEVPVVDLFSEQLNHHASS